MDFSVLISVYKKEISTNLDRALHSLVSQSLMPKEIVLVKDGNLTDDLDTCINNYVRMYPELFSVIALENNVGLGEALRFGLQYCTFELVARMDSDDICYSDRFEKQVNVMRRRMDLSVLGAGIQEFIKEPGDLKQYRRSPAVSDHISGYAKFRNPINHPTVIFKRSAVLSVGSYQDMPLFEDYYLWVRMIVNGYKIANIDEPVLHFRIGNDMIGRRSGFQYVKKEYNFLLAIKKLKFINKREFLFSLVAKLPLRLLPKKLLLYLYKFFLR